MVLNGHIEDELGRGIIPKDVEDLSVAARIGQAGVVPLSPIEIIPGDKLIETDLPVDNVAIPIGRNLGMDCRGTIAVRAQLLG